MIQVSLARTGAGFGPVLVDIKTMCEKWLSFFAHGFLLVGKFLKSGKKTGKLSESTLNRSALYLGYPEQDSIGVKEELSKEYRERKKRKWKKDFQRKAL